MSDKTPNRQLAALMAEAAISNKGLAARVKKISAGRVGGPLATDHTTVSRWLSGTVPLETTAALVAEAVSAKLGRSVTPSDIGFPEAVPAPTDNDYLSVEYPDAPEAAVGRLADLTVADLHDQPAAIRLEWSPGGAPPTITSYLFGSGGPVSLEVTNKEPVTATAIRDTASHLMSLDFSFGGGHVRKMLLIYFQADVVPLLRSSIPDPTRRNIYSAAAEVTQLLGWSAYDAGRHGAAQRYFVQGLRLAREAGDHMLGGRLLSNLSHQANFLGRFEEAVQYARAAQSAVQGRTSATVGAMLLAMEARALASTGDEARCAVVLGRAELMFGRRDISSDPAWISYFNDAELAGEASHCFRDLRRSNETAAFADRAVEPTDTPPRTRAFIDMVKAQGALNAGNLDEAMALAVTAVDLAGPLQSHRYLRYLTDFRRALGREHPGAGALLEVFDSRVSGTYPSLLLPPIVS